MTRMAYPVPLNEQVSARMRRNGRRDTKPERTLRSLLHANGLRFRKDYAVRAGDRLVRPDVVFTRQRIAIFLDGCYWHACPQHGTQPRRNSEYWTDKLKRNIARDKVVNQALSACGWRVIRVWEHEDPAEAAETIAAAVRRQQTSIGA
jgi:DNA mismatch endonuclease, patch repair protein